MQEGLSIILALALISTVILALTLWGCEKPEDKIPVGSFRISIQANGIGDTVYVVQEYEILYWNGETDKHWENYNLTFQYKNLQQAEEYVKRIKQQREQANFKEVKIIPQ